MWLYGNAIKYDNDLGIIDFVGVNTKPDMRLTKF